MNSQGFLTAHQVVEHVGYLTHNEVDALHTIARSLRPNALCVNIGAGAGTSTLALLEARFDIEVYSVDIDAGALSGELSRLRESGQFLVHRHHQVLMPSASFGLRFAPHALDFVFVDGAHDGPGVRADIEVFVPRVRSGGWIAFHDYWPYPANHALAGMDYWPDVRAVVNETMGDHKMVMDADRMRVFEVRHE